MKENNISNIEILEFIGNMENDNYKKDERKEDEEKSSIDKDDQDKPSIAYMDYR